MKISYTKKLKYLICTFFSIFCLSLGFSSWTLAEQVKTDLVFEVGKIENFDYKNSAGYEKNSEYFFDYYIFNGTYKFTSNMMGLNIIVKPNLVEQYFDNKDVSILIGVEYTVLSSMQFDIFLKGNKFVVPPTYFRCNLDGFENYYINSSELIYSNHVVGGYTTYSLKGNVFLNSKYSNSLKSICDGFSDPLEAYTFNVSFNFKILDSINLSNYLQNTKFKFTTSLGASI